MIACENGHLSIVRALIDQLANVGVANEVMVLATNQDSYVMYSHMQRGHTCLMAACQNGHLDIVKLLLSLPQVDVNAKDRVIPVVISPSQAVVTLTLSCTGRDQCPNVCQ